MKTISRCRVKRSDPKQRGQCLPPGLISRDDDGTQSASQGVRETVKFPVCPHCGFMTFLQLAGGVRRCANRNCFRDLKDAQPSQEAAKPVPDSEGKTGTKRDAGSSASNASAEPAAIAGSV